MSLSRAAVLAALVSALGTIAPAQSLSELLPRLLSEGLTMPSTVGTVAGNPHEAHFLPAAAQLKAPYALNGAMVTQLSTFPLGSSSGGFTYTTDRGTGIPERSSNNFGPAFAERALTIGKGHFSAGFNFQHVEFERFEDQSLDGGLRFYLQHNDCCPLQNPDGTPNPTGTGGPSPSTDKNPFFEGDLVRADVTLNAQTDTFVLFANYGLTRRIDVGVALPIVRVEVDASISSTLERLATSGNPTIHSFGGQSPDQRVARESGSSTGLGDVVLRAKWNVMPAPGGGLALGVDLRLPTGDENELRGTGATQAKGSFYYTGEFGKFSPHINVGYTFSSGSIASGTATYQLGDEATVPTTTTAPVYTNVFRGQSPESPLTEADLEVPDEIYYTAGFVVAAHPKVTLNADFIGRTLKDVNRFLVTPQSFNFRLPSATGAPANPLQSRTFDDALDVVGRSDLRLLLGVVGVKINVSRTILLTANVLFPLSSDGLRPKVTPVIGIDYAF